MLCYSVSGFAGGTYTVNEAISMWLGNSYTIIAPETYKYATNASPTTFLHYVWEYDETYFSVEYLQPRHDVTNSTGDNVIKVTILMPFQGTKAITCCAYNTDDHAIAPSSNNTVISVKFNYNITCNPVNIILYPTETTMDVGESQNLQWMFNPQVSQYYVFALFSSNNPSVATVDLFGKVTAKGPGTATITATTNYGTTATCEVTVNPLLASSISLSQTSMNLAIGTTRALTDTILPIVASNKAVMWTSSNESIATVDADGKVTAISKGIANITATTTDGTNLSADCLITVFSEGDSSSTGGNTSDVNNDGSTDIDDVTSLIQLILGL